MFCDCSVFDDIQVAIRQLVDPFQQNATASDNVKTAVGAALSFFTCGHGNGTSAGNV